MVIVTSGCEIGLLVGGKGVDRQDLGPWVELAAIGFSAC